MTSLRNIWFSKLHILWNLIEGISFPNFIGLGCLDQILRGPVKNTPPPPDLHALKKPSPYRVNARMADAGKIILGWQVVKYPSHQ